MHDVVIIGSGPAGLTAAIYLLRAGRRVLLLEKEVFGGQITYSPKVENYPGFQEMSGNEFAEKLLDQAIALGAEIELDTVKDVETGNVKTVHGETKTYQAGAVIVATGSKHRHLHVPGEEELVGKQISFCAVCDGAFYQGKKAILVGGGNTALQEAVLLSEICMELILVQNLAFLTGEQKLQEMLFAKKNVTVIYQTVVTGFSLENGQLKTDIRNTADNTEKILYTDGAFIAVGQEPENQPFAKLCQLDKNGYILSGEDCRTQTPGIFAAGDCRTKTVRQITTATGDGAVAAVYASRYLDDIGFRA